MRTIALATCIAAAAIAAIMGWTHEAAASEQWQSDYIVFSRGTSLWRTDPRGKASALAVASLPEGRTATDVSALKTDAAGRVLLAEISSKWYWLALDSNEPKLQPLACGPGSAELAPQANYVVCAGTKRGTAIIRLADGVITSRDVPAQGARLATEGTGLDLIWADKTGIWRAPLAKPKQIIKVASSAPIHDFSISPDGSRAVGFFDDPPHGPMLFGFALDGIAARRKGIKAGIPLNWSHDGMWVLVQDGTSACLMRTLGGQYKCWKGYVAGAAAPDGRWQLMFGNDPAPTGKADKGSSKSKTAGKGKNKDIGKKPDKNGGKGKRPNGAATPVPSEPPVEPPSESGAGLPNEGADSNPDESGDDEPGAEGHNSESATPTMAPLGKGPHNLYRGQLEGAFTDAPTLVLRDVAGAVVWVPVRTPPITSGLPAYAPTPPSAPAVPTPGTPVPSAPSAPLVPAAPIPPPTPAPDAATTAPKAPKVRSQSGSPARR